MHTVRPISLPFASLLVVTVSQAITVGQVDTFQGGTLLGWAGASPTNVSTGGPAGSGDRYLRLTSTGAPSAGGSMACYNLTQWTGNFHAAGVRLIECDMRNQGSTFLNMRVILFSEPLDRYSTTISIDLPPGSGWVHAYLPIRESDLVQVDGTTPYSIGGATITRFMFRHNPVPSPTGVPMAAQLGIDNIRAHAGWKVSGNLNFDGLDPSVPAPENVTLEYRNPGSTTPVYTAPAIVSPNGDYWGWTPPVPGSYDLSVKVGAWLRRTVNIPSTNMDVLGFDLNLINGDVDGDNEVSIGDYALLSASFGTSEGDPGWNAQADLNGDLTIDIGDYAILSASFGQIGDD